jgi:uncharacterized protein (TIGR02466 family)
MEKIVDPFFSAIMHTNEFELKSHDMIQFYLETLWNHSPYHGKAVAYTANYNDGFCSKLHLDPLFKELCDIILDKATKFYLKNHESIQSLGFFLTKPKELEITKMWFNVMTPYAHQGLHHHNECVVAGTYYVRMPENCGAITFENPNSWAYQMGQQCMNDTMVLDCHGIEPAVGDLLIWPGWMSHQVHTNQSNDNRISISFGLAFKKEE